MMSCGQVIWSREKDLLVCTAFTERGSHMNVLANALISASASDADTREVYAKKVVGQWGACGRVAWRLPPGITRLLLSMSLTSLRLLISQLMALSPCCSWLVLPESAVVDDKSWLRFVRLLHGSSSTMLRLMLLRFAVSSSPSIGNVIVCDTSFHFNMPEKAHRYALPR